MDIHSDDPTAPIPLEKRWFIYLDDTHIGPFSLDEIQAKIEGGKVSTQDYIWSEEMTDWQVIEEAKTFQPLLRKRSEMPSNVSFKSSFKSSGKASGKASGKISDGVPKLYPQSQKPIKIYTKLKQHKFRIFIKKHSVLLLCMALLLLTSFSYLHTILKTRRILSVTQNSDLSPEENGSLRASIVEPLDSFGPTATTAMSHEKALGTSFYIATNCPDGTKFDLEMTGLSDTLVGRTHASGHAVVQVENGVGKTMPLNLLTGQPFPVGEYQVTIRLSSHQPKSVISRLESDTASTRDTSTSLAAISLMTGKILNKNTYFWGTKNQEYDQTLKSYHDALREKAEAEILEINQFTAMLEAQLQETNTEFNNIIQRNKPSDADATANSDASADAKKWNEFHLKWTQLETKLEVGFKKWTAEWLAESAYYGKLYSLLLQGGQFIGQVHQEQGRYFEEGADKKSIELSVTKLVSVTQSVILSLKVKTQLIERLPATANGMPHPEDRDIQN